MTEKRFTMCEYYQDSIKADIVGYCTNPLRHNKVNGVALLCCQGNNCELDTKEKWW